MQRRGGPTENRVNGNTKENQPAEKPYTVAIPSAPVTSERIPYVPKPEDPLIDAGTARANVAASVQRPNGTEGWAQRHKDKTVLHQHVIYWDPDRDGIIWPQDTYKGIRAWGWSLPLAFIAAYIIHVGLSYSTVPGYLPDPFFRIWIERQHKSKHGSDSMSFDNEGRFRPQNFEDFFSKYDRDNKGGLDASDLFRAWRGQMMFGDLFGASAAGLEWLATYLLLWPDDGIVRKEDARRVFDGSIFQDKADEYQQRRRRMGLKAA